MSKKSKKKTRKAESVPAFSDDSSAALGLSHRSRVHRPLDAVIAVREQDLSPATQAIRAFARRVDALVREGYDPADASQIASAEASEESARIGAGLPPEPEPERDLTPDELAKKRSKDYLGASVQSLMGGRSSTHHGGKSAKSRRKTAKRGTWICKECHLEYCAHRPRSQTCLKCGRERKGCGCAQGRSQMVSARVSGTVRKALRTSSVSAGLIVESVVLAAIESGLGPARVHEILGALSAPSSGEGIR